MCFLLAPHPAFLPAVAFRDLEAAHTPCFYLPCQNDWSG
jgi:hypothetical protein